MTGTFAGTRLAIMFELHGALIVAMNNVLPDRKALSFEK